ncbi:hypothetical protein C8A03DRAFT_18677 [Achaetomium macrosporum]|uniref:Uncharacterized protein n=1 Tax=Achaetomium macrosporum TaxID=79813 RepID=A0AAN7C330_9PEZI|nr:hypothetical protein C8A03DRAFT_18677 [Achaetomium macrosporum]
MPAVPHLNLNLPLLVAGRATENHTRELESVICAFPLSGQYGPGSRILYYVLVAACVLARKTEWLRNACLAAALIFPAIAAIHGIVLASLHLDDAVDMDIYGAFQFCTIGILTAPATVRLSKTYFNNPGRNVLFLWTMLVIAGLLALAVEFFRTHSSPCTDNGFGQPLYRGSLFPYGETTCGLTCSIEHGPYSPMRDGSADNVYVVPTPSVLTFGAATLVAAACCIPGVLSMISLWDKILRTNFVKEYGDPDADELIDGTNLTVRGEKTINDVIRRLLSRVEIPVFGGAVLALIIVGEMNFWSEPVKFETEPIANVGQWSNIAASVFAAVGSLYMLLAESLETTGKGEIMASPTEPCNCACHEHGRNHPGSLSDHTETAEIPQPPERASTVDTNLYRRDTSQSHKLSPIRTDTQPDGDDHAHDLGIHRLDSGSSGTGNRREVVGSKALMKFATAFGTASPDRFYDREFREGKATGFPEIPGEGTRNPKLNQIKEQWGQPNLDGDDALTSRGRRSRANSFNSVSRPSSIGPRAHSPQPPMTPQPTSTSFLGLPATSSPETISETAFPPRPSIELEKTKWQGTNVTLHDGPNSPAIVLSSEEEPSEPSDSGAATPPATEQLPF